MRRIPMFGLLLAFFVVAVEAGAGSRAVAQSGEQPEALNQRVIALYKAGQIAEAIPLAERYVEATKNLGKSEQASALNNLAMLYRATDRLGEAEQLYRRALAIEENASRLNNLGWLLRFTNRLADAEPLMRRALAINERNLGPWHPEVANDLMNLGKLLEALERTADAEPLMRRALEIDEKNTGPEHPDVARDLGILAHLLISDRRPREAEPLLRRALAIDERHLGAQHPGVARDLNNLAQVLKATDRWAEAEPLMRRSLEINQKSQGPDGAEVAVSLINLALLLQNTNRLAEAEPLMRRALAIQEKSLGPEHHDVATGLNNLAGLLMDIDREAEAEPLYRRALAIDETIFGPDHPNVARRLNNLAQLLRATSRLADAEPLMRRALAIDERGLGPLHPDVARDLNNLAALLKTTNRLAEAEPLYRRALSIRERTYGPDHTEVAVVLNNLAQLFKVSNRLAEAEPLMRRALAIDEQSLGHEHPAVARDLSNLAGLLQSNNVLAESDLLYRRALAIDEASYGRGHPQVGIDLGNLAQLRAERGDWADAAALGRRATPILIARKLDETAGRGDVARRTLTRNSQALRFVALATHHAKPDDADAREAGFALAQWSLQTGAADALTQMSVRFGKGSGPLGSLVRERQDLVARRQGEMRRLDAATGRTDLKDAGEARAAVAALEQRLDAIEARLSAEFKEYAELAHPAPLTIAGVQALLRPEEALVLFLDAPKFGRVPGESLVWIVTKEAASWRSILLGTRALSERVSALRCGLDTSNWDETAGWPEETALDREHVREQQARRKRCKDVLGLEVSASDWPPFDLARAYELYQSLLGPVADLTSGKHLFIVPSGPLTSLPFHVLVTEKPDPTLVGMARYQKAAWLALRQPTTVLPSVGSLQALRRLPASQATSPYIAFGNPLLLGSNGDDKSASLKKDCTQQTAAMRVAEARGGIALRAFDLAQLREQAPLPETADELCAVAEALGVSDRDTDSVWLGERATEHNLKTLSREGKLVHFKVVHFATHGLVSSQSEAFLQRKAEPALILTPPPDATPPDLLDEDDGLLTASEIAQLELDADWVVLSACNTAAGENSDAEALSGLARAFFYAKARALLVSHWPVYSGAAVKLTTRTFAELKRDPRIPRAEALRRSMAALIESGIPQEAHPATWAPFVLVGEGGRQGRFAFD